MNKDVMSNTAEINAKGKKKEKNCQWTNVWKFLRNMTLSCINTILKTHIFLVRAQKIMRDIC